MSGDRDALFLQLLRSRGLDRPSDVPIGKSGRVESRLSLPQERMWFLEQLQPGQPTYHIPLVFRLGGELDAEALRLALGDVAARHEALRSVFPSVRGRPRQVVNDDFAVPWSVVDVGDLCWDEVLSRAEQETRAPFALDSGPLLRACLLRISPVDHVMVITVHHIVFDGWSLGIFTRELATFFEARRAGRVATLPKLPIQYGDFAEWQRDWLSGAVLEDLLEYWRERLAGAPPVLELPADRRRPAVQSHRGRQEVVVVPRDVVAGLRAVCKREHVTMFMVLLAAFKVLLSRYSGQQDVVVGTPIANRSRVEVEPLIGFFVNTLVLRTDLSGDPTVSELLERVRDTALGAYAHEDLPFARSVEELRPERDLSQSPLVQVVFALLNTPDHAPELAGLTVEVLAVEPQVAKFDVSVFLREAEDQLVGGVEYSTDLFDRRTIVRFWQHYAVLLRSIAAAAPESRSSTLCMVSDDEHDRLLNEWNASPHQEPSDECLHHAFEAQAKRTPEHIALVFRDRSLTYRQLDCAANRLARWLRERNVRVESVVGLYFERSAEMFVAMLAVLKAGAAYLPLDPRQPQSRVEFMLHDSGADLVLTQDALVGRLPGTIRSCTLTDDDLRNSGYSDEPLACPVPANALAYVIYTSGSTGVPKGVMIEHRSIVNEISALAAEIDLRAEDRLLAVAALAFDIATLDLFGPLSRGATVIVADSESLADGHLLIRLLEKSGASVMQATPSLWRMLFNSGWQGQPRLRVLCGGEALPPDLLARLLPVVERVWNVYGPTETTVWSHSASVDASTVESGRVPIGRTIANTRVYVVDAAGDLVATGLPGELLIGGCGVARGYVNRPALTAERFIPDSFSTRNGQRLYRTGDVVRYLVDGSLDFLQRSDHQIKLNGFRVELGEIENVLLLHPQVGSAVVVLREDRSGEPKLVGYFTRAGTTVSTIEWRQWLQERLPAYMIPTTLVELDALPVNVNGKIDRLALPPPGRFRPELEGGYVAPRAGPESLLVELFADVLDLPAGEIGVNDDFFALGGQSLPAVALVARICAAFGVDLPLSALFNARTVSALIPMIGESRPAQSAPGIQDNAPAIPRLRRNGHVEGGAPG